MHDEDAPPYGLSGGGVWGAATKAGIWTPANGRLIGLQRSRLGEVLVAQRISTWLAMLAEDVPELAGEIAASGA
jgi:hypothetical protein